MQRRRNSGFTLIEMLVVVAILVITAGLLLPKLDKVQLRANKGVAANNAHGVSRYVQTFRIIHNYYPDRWDSLLNTDGTALAGNLEPQLNGSIPGGPTKLRIETTPLTDEETRSLARMGISTVMLPGSSTQGGIPGDQYVVPVSITTSAYATLNSGPSGDGDANAIVDHIYTDNQVNGTTGIIPGGKKLIVFGFGPTNTCMGDVLQECPFYSNTDPARYYHRFLAVFEISSGGSRCELKTVLGADADRIEEEINDFYE